MIYVYGIFPDYVTLEGLGTFVEIPYTHTPRPFKRLDSNRAVRDRLSLS